MKLVRLSLRVVAGAALVVASAADAAASGAHRLTIEDALRWRLASRPALSPDGKRVAYLVAENDLEKSRRLTHLNWVDLTTRQSRRLTPGDEEASEPRWAPDGRWLAFLSARGEDPQKRKPQVWLLPMGGGEAFAVTRAPEGVRHYRWAPDGKSLYYVVQEALPAGATELRAQREKRKLDMRIVDEERYRREIWRVTIEDRKEERIFAGDLGLDSLEPSPDGKWILYRTNYTGFPDDTRKYDLWLLELATGRARQLTRRAGEERSPVWSPDATRVAFLAPRVPDIVYAQEEVFVVPVAAAPELPEPRRVTKNFDGNIDGLHWPARGHGIYFAAGLRTGNRLFLLHPADGSLRPLSDEAHFLSEPDWAADGSACTALLEGPQALPEVAWLSFASPQAGPEKLTDLNPQLREFRLGAQEAIRWKSKDGLEIEGLLVKPPDWQPGQKLPLLLQVHGGPFDRRTNTLTSGHFPQVWAARGWLVLLPNFRGSSGYGHDFGVANRGDLGGRDYEDIMAGVDSVIAQGWADEKRMAVMGGSYGGYMTNWIIGRTKRFQAAASLYGIFSLITDYSNSEFPSWEPDYLLKFYWDDLQTYLDRSPMKFVKQIQTPVLLLHGEEDNNTFISNSKEMYQALKALGRTVRFVRLPREGHGFEEPNHRLEQFRMTAAWLEQYALGRDARAREVPEKIRRGVWELQVAAVRTPADYAGIAPKGRFVEVELLLRAVEPVHDRFSLLVFDSAGTEVSLRAGEEPLYPAGLVAESLGERLLVTSSAQVVAVAPGKDGGPSALAVAVAFDAPAERREFILKVKEFPEVRIELPPEAKKP